jgi:hypothetical protein
MIDGAHIVPAERASLGRVDEAQRRNLPPLKPLLQNLSNW